MQKLQMTDVEMGDLARMLRKVNFFSPLTVGQLEMVVPFIMLVSYEAQEVVFKQGQAGDAFYIVYSGRVEVKIKKGLLSFTKTVATSGPGDFFGEMALLAKGPRTATIECVEPSKFFVLLASDFEYLLAQNPELATQMDRLAAQRKLLSSQG